MNFSKSQVRKLGDQIRTEDHEGIAPNDLDKLEDYRIFFKDIISTIFNDLHPTARSVRHDAITTYRIKRIESIVRKLHRYPSMELDRMWDIAGCRCILKSPERVLKLRDRLYNEFHVIKEKNYYQEPSPDGYKSIHLYLTKNKEDKWPIEVQLRSYSEHNWATLVEIVDQLYGISLKEGEKHTGFEKFFLLMSNLNGLNNSEKYKLIKLTHENQVFQKLYSVFLQNYLTVRKNWLELNKPKSHHFFVVEVQNSQPVINSFGSFDEAEKIYFDKYNVRSSSNIVLTYLPHSNFENFEKAYSNYTLTTHNFIDDYFRLLSDVSGFLLQENKFGEFYSLYKHSQENFYSNLINVHLEFNVIRDVSENNQNKAKYWNRDFKQRISKRVELINRLTKKIEQVKITSSINRLRFNYYLWRINKRDKRFQKKFTEYLN